MVVVTTVVAAAILLANAPREGVTGGKVDEVEEEEGEDEDEDEDAEEEDEGGGDDGIGWMTMNTGNRDTAFGNEFLVQDRAPTPSVCWRNVFKPFLEKTVF